MLTEVSVAFVLISENVILLLKENREGRKYGGKTSFGLVIEGQFPTLERVEAVFLFDVLAEKLNGALVDLSSLKIFECLLTHLLTSFTSAPNVITCRLFS